MTTDSAPEERECSRRAVLAGAATVAGGALASSPVAGTPAPIDQPGAESPSLLPAPGETRRGAASSLGTPGEISPRGRQAMAAMDHVLAQQREPPERTVDAVNDLGLDPEGTTPINQAFESAVSSLSNVRIEFPGDATFRVAGDMVLNPAGPLDIIGNGTTLQMDAETAGYAMNISSLPSGSLIQGIRIDMSQSGACAGLRVVTDGMIELRDIRMQGYASPTPQGTGPNILVPVARTREAIVRVRNFVAVGGTAAGMHKDPGEPSSAPENRLSSPICLWVGQSTLGTVQLANPRIRGWSNGTYSGRTKGRVEVLGGVLWNNTNCQVRISGDSMCDGATLVLDDTQWSMEENPGAYAVGANQGVNAVRVDPGGARGNQSDPVELTNLRIIGRSMEISSSLLDFEGSAGPGLIRNCRITNNLDGTPVVWGERPGSQHGLPAAPQTNIQIEDCRIEGTSSAPVVRADSRPDSRVRRTCITMPDAGSEDIQGAQIGQGVAFGQCGSNSGLSAPEAVGSNVSVSDLPAPNASSLPPLNGRARQQRQQGVFVAVADGMFLLLVLFLGMITLFVVGIAGSLGALVAVLGGGGGDE